MTKRRVLVCGAGGFIGGHLVKRLKAENCWVRGIDLKRNPFGNQQYADEFIVGDLRNPETCHYMLEGGIDDVYQLAADMGGAGYIFTGEQDAHVMHNSALCNLNTVEAARQCRVKRIFYSSSACMYPEYNQLDPENPKCTEDSAYPAQPDSEYGWEKLFSERLYFSYQRNHNMQVRVARFHNIYGPQGSWKGGREKAPAALCRKVAEAQEGGTIQVWGDGKQTRSFLYVEECVEAVWRLMGSDFPGPVNIGSEEMLSIGELAQMIIEISQKNLEIEYIEGPTGVRGRNSDNKLIAQKLGWQPHAPLREGLEKTYAWIAKQVRLEGGS